MDTGAARIRENFHVLRQSFNRTLGHLEINARTKGFAAYVVDDETVHGRELRRDWRLM
jgi:hypothetical protein